MMFKIGDRVVVINESLDSHGAVGFISDIDKDWVYPYEVDFDGREYDANLFDNDDLAYVDSEDDSGGIKFQEGTVKDNGVNGVQIEDVIDVLIGKWQEYQRGELPCRENALAITKLEEARMWLNERTRNREKQGVEGDNLNHE